MLTKTSFTPKLEALITAKSADSNDLIKEFLNALSINGNTKFEFGLLVHK